MRFYRLSPYILVFLIFISQIAFAQNTDNFPAKRDPPPSAGEKSEIYPKLRDRRCTTMTLDKCNCADAREMKAYIEALIETDVGKDEIFYKVAKKFSINTILDERIKTQVKEKLIKEAGGKAPQIILEPTIFNFGQVSKKQGKISKSFKLSNKGNANLVIKRIKTSCPCTFVSLNKSPYFGTAGSPKDWQAEIKSAQSQELEVMLDLASPHIKAGKVMRDAMIISNDPVYPEVTVMVEAEAAD